MLSSNENSISGFIFLIEISYLFLLDDNNNICTIEGKEEKINEFKDKKSYKIYNLEYLGIDHRNYHKYRFKNNTKFENSNGNKYINHAIIKLIVLDTIEINMNPKLKINNIKYNIVDNIQYIPILIDDKYSYDLFSLELSYNSKNRIYKSFLYKKEINIIYCSLKEDNLISNKSYEIIYLSKKAEFLPKEIYVSGYKIKEYDKFSCSNRIRFNIINVKKDKRLYYYNDNVSSYEIIYLINEKNKTNKYGVFNLASYKKGEMKNYIIHNKYSEKLQKFYDNYNKNKKYDCDEIDSYYNSQISELDINQEDKKNFFNEMINRYISQYKKESLNTHDAYIYFKNLCFFIFFSITIERAQYAKFDEYFQFLEKIHNYDNYTKIKLLFGFINIINNLRLIPQLTIINNLEKENPYYLAIKLQKNIISNLNEISKIFYPILQFNSNILEILPDNYINIINKKIKKLFNTNQNQKSNYAYTISLENIEDIKERLISIEEDFFFVLEDYNSFDFYGSYDKYSQTTIINKYLLYENINLNKKPTNKKDFSFAINMSFFKERMSQGKESLINQIKDSPNIFFNINFKKEYINSSYLDKNENISGRIFEKYIGHQLLLNAMKRDKCFGKFLDYKYFIGDFKEIKEEAKKLIKNDFFYEGIKFYSFVRIIIELSIYTLIFSLLYFDKSYLNFNFKFSLIIFISLIFIIYFINDLRIYINPLNDNEILYNIIYEKKIKNDKEEKILIFPDHYPLISETFLDKIFPFLDYRKKKLREKFSKYISDKENLYWFYKLNNFLLNKIIDRKYKIFLSRLL